MKKKLYFFLAGLYFCFKNVTDHNIFIILYGLTSIYFSGVMVRLMLVLAPIMCILGGITISNTLSNFVKNIDTLEEKKTQLTNSNNLNKSRLESYPKNSKKGKDDNYPHKSEVFFVLITNIDTFFRAFKLLL